MNQEQILARLQGVFQEVFDDEEIIIGPQTSAKDIEGWDSLVHMQLISEVEGVFDIRLSMGEVQNFQNVGDLCAAVERHVNRA